jgi:ribonucleoside-diphosphate reductase alpha chain
MLKRIIAAHRCPDCGGPLVHGEGCILCPICGFTHCS